MTIHKLDKRVFFGQKAFIKKDDKVLVLRDPGSAVKGQTGLDLPGGKYRWGKSFASELKREVLEETGLEIVIGKPFVVWTYFGLKMRRGSSPHTVLIGYLCTYKSGKITLSEEHDKFEWVDKNSYKKWRDKTEDFKALEAYFRLNTGA